MKRLIIAAALASLAFAPAAFAKPGEGQDHGKGHAKSHGKGHDKGHGKVSAQPQAAPSATQSKNWTLNNGVWTHPAGRTHPHGMPPGQAKKLAKQNGGLAVGQVLSPSYPGYQNLPASNVQNLPAAPAGHEYVRVGDQVYLRQTQSGVIASVIQNLLR